MIYLDIIVTDTEDSIEITGKKDHQWMGLHDVLKKPKVSLWTLYRLKKFLETSYERLNKETEVQSSAGSVDAEVGISGTDPVEGTGRPKVNLGSNKG